MEVINLCTHTKSIETHHDWIRIHIGQAQRCNYTETSLHEIYPLHKGIILFNNVVVFLALMSIPTSVKEGGVNNVII